MFTACSAQCRYKVQESFSIKWATVWEYESSHRVCYPSGHSSPTAGNTHEIIWVLSEYLNPKAHSCEGSKQWLLVARVCQKLNPLMTVRDNVKEAWGSTCFQSLEEILLWAAPGWGRKKRRGSLLATLNVISSSSSCGGCKVGQISSVTSCILILTSWMTV